MAVPPSPFATQGACAQHRKPWERSHTQSTILGVFFLFSFVPVDGRGPSPRQWDNLEHLGWAAVPLLWSWHVPVQNLPSLACLRSFPGSIWTLTSSLCSASPFLSSTASALHCPKHAIPGYFVYALSLSEISALWGRTCRGCGKVMCMCHDCFWSPITFFLFWDYLCSSQDCPKMNSE